MADIEATTNSPKKSNSSSQLVRSVVASLSAEKEWPNNVVVYTKLEAQDLLTDIARGYVVKALLAVHGLEEQYAWARRHNAEYMAPKSGKLPFLRVDNDIIANEDILEFFADKQYTLRNDLTVEETLLMQGIISMIETKLIPLELYALWMIPANRKQTQERYGYNMPEPLKTIICWKKFREVKRHLKVLGILEKSESEIKEDLAKIFQCLSSNLENNRCILGEDLCEADVYAYGHLQSILESTLKDNILMRALEAYPKLTNFCLNFNQLHLGNQAMIWEFI